MKDKYRRQKDLTKEDFKRFLHKHDNTLILRSEDNMPKKDICSVLLGLPDEKLRLLETLIQLLDSDGSEPTGTDKTAVDSNVDRDVVPEADEVG